MAKKLSFLFLAVIVGFFVACCNDEEALDKNSMKGEWAFTSATDGVTYGDVRITNVGAPGTATYENIWLMRNPWGTSQTIFKITVENDNLKNMIFSITVYYWAITMELIECSDEIGGTMKLKNWTDDITYTYERIGN